MKDATPVQLRHGSRPAPAPEILLGIMLGGGGTQRLSRLIAVGQCGLMVGPRFGLPADDVARVRASTTDFWTNEPGRWVYEWSALAAEYTATNRPLLAALAYGCAKFPCLADDARKTALDKQIASYLAVSPAFGVRLGVTRWQISAPAGPSNFGP